MIDCVVRGGLVVDGRGAAARVADVCVDGGRIVAVGASRNRARHEIDADGLVVAPGFVDLHTHYDAQLCWDPTASPSLAHGVTTVVGGNCGFGLAPASSADTRYLTRLLARVEGMPMAALEATLDWRWDSFASFLDRMDGKLVVNAGFLCGHSTIRRAVLGDRAHEPACDAGEIERLCAALRDALAEGALGFSTSLSPTHHDAEARPVPSRCATRSELEALATETGRHPGTTLEGIVPGCLRGFDDGEVDLLATLSAAADRPLNWNLLSVDLRRPELHQRQLDAATRAAARGAAIVALTLPFAPRVRLSFLSGAVLDGLPGWNEVLGRPVAERMQLLASPEVRERLASGAASEAAGVLRSLARWERLEILETFAEVNAGLAGRTVGDVARERGHAPFDALLDVVIADDLRTGLAPPAAPDDAALWSERAKVWLDPRTVLGGSDAGAHLDVLCAASYPTRLLGDAVRDRRLLSLERAVHELSDVPARLYGLRQRGRIEIGFHADLVVFDATRVGAGDERTVADLPGGAARIVTEARGVEHVLVNGVEVMRHGVFTGARPGCVLRSGRDTETVSARAWLKERLG